MSHRFWHELTPAEKKERIEKHNAPEKQWYEEAHRIADLNDAYLRNIDYLQEKLGYIVAANRGYEQIAVSTDMAKLLLDALEKY